MARLAGELRAGDDNLVPCLEPHCGGVGANAAILLARWGVPVRLLGCVGRDWFGEFALRLLKNEGIALGYVQQSDRALTGLIFIPVNRDGQRTIIGSRGANAEYAGTHGDWACLDGANALHLVGYDFLSRVTRPFAEELVTRARQRGLCISLDVGVAPSQQIPDTIRKIARDADLLFIGLNEAMALTGRREHRDVLSAVERFGAREVVVKLGSEGCLLGDEGRWREVPPLRVAVVDTTGSGDAFAAAFLRARLNHWSSEDAALLANAAGAATAAVLGAGECMPGPPAILCLLEQNELPPRWEDARRRVLQLLRNEFSPAKSAGFSGG
jgi:sugar/nucleoside kinase (ribokinase family)